MYRNRHPAPCVLRERSKHTMNTARIPIPILLAVALCSILALAREGRCEKADERLYDQARSYYRKIVGGKIHPSRRNWAEAIRQFRRVVRSYPESDRADDALYSIGLCHLRQDDCEHAVTVLSELSTKYPKSNLADDALYLIGNCHYKSDDMDRAMAAYRKLVEAYPGGDMYEKALDRALEYAKGSENVEELKRIYTQIVSSESGRWIASRYAQKIERISSGEARGGRPKASRASAERSGCSVQGVRTSSSRDMTRVVIDLDTGAEYEVHTLQDPSRLYVDLHDAVLIPPRWDPLRVGDGIVKQVRVAQLSDRAVRVVLDMESLGEYNVFSLSEPERIVIDLAPSTSEMVYRSVERRPSLAGQLGLKIRTIVIDPGHGGKDPGAMGFGLKEKEIALDIAKRLKGLLEKDPTYEVYLTRETDVFVPLDARTTYANQKEADLFASVHVNACKRPSKRGIETYYLSARATDEDAQALAAFENAMSREPMSSLEHMLKRIARNAKIEESRSLAGVVQSKLVKRTKEADLGVKRAPFVVLIGAKMPAILAEVGFLSNESDAKLLGRGIHRQHIAQGLADAIRAYSAQRETVVAK